MKAITYTEFGPPEVLQVVEKEKPTPKDNELLVRIHAAPVNYGDILARKFNEIGPSKFNMPGPLWLPTRLLFGLRKPRVSILGSEFAGEVEAVGTAVTRFKVGDQVFGYRGMNMGAYAEYLCVKEDSMVALKPSNMNFEEAASLPYGSFVALQILRRQNIQSGQHVLVNGASGGIGSYALQLAKHYGAEVTGVCSTPRVEYVRSLGADHVIDYKQEDFTEGSERYDLIIDVLGKAQFGRSKRVLKPGGRHVYISFRMKQVFQMLWTRFVGDKRVICSMAGEKQADLDTIRELVEAGALKSVVDKTFPMEEAAAAHRHIEDGNKQGQVVLIMV